MTDGEEKKSSLLLDSFKEVLGRFSYRPENRQYIIFRAILLCVAALLVLRGKYRRAKAREEREQKK